MRNTNLNKFVQWKIQNIVQLNNYIMKINFDELNNYDLS